MKYISIRRHAKAERPETYANDYDRPLTERVQRDAQRMSAILTRLDPAIDLIVSSLRRARRRRRRRSWRNLHAPSTRNGMLPPIWLPPIRCLICSRRCPMTWRMSCS